MLLKIYGQCSYYILNGRINTEDPQVKGDGDSEYM